MSGAKQLLNKCDWPKLSTSWLIISLSVWNAWKPDSFYRWTYAKGNNVQYLWAPSLYYAEKKNMEKKMKYSLSQGIGNLCGKAKHPILKGLINYVRSTSLFKWVVPILSPLKLRGGMVTESWRKFFLIHSPPVYWVPMRYLTAYCGGYKGGSVRVWTARNLGLLSSPHRGVGLHLEHKFD